MRSLLALLLLAAPPALLAGPQEDSPPAPPPRPRGAPAAVQPRPAAPRGDWLYLGLSPASDAILQELVGELQLGHAADPARYFGRILILEPHRYRELIDLINKLSLSLAQQAYGPSLKSSLWMEYVRQNAKSPAGYAGLAQSLGEQGRYGPAVAAYSQAIQLGGGTPQNYYGRGFAAEQAGDHELANRDARKVLSMTPDDQSALSLYKLTQNLVSKVKLDPATGDAAGASGLIAAGPPAGGADAVPMGGGYSTPPADSDPARMSSEMTQLATQFFQLGDWNSAIKAAARAVQLDPKNARAHNLLAMALDRSGEHEKALGAADSALSLAPESIPALNTRAWALNALRRYGDALKDSQKALSLNPNDGHAFLNKARAQGGLGNRSEMLDSLRRAAELDPNLRGLYETASQLPRTADADLLFSGLFDAKNAPVAQLPAAVPLAAARRKLLTMWLTMMAGGFMVLFGLVHALSSSWRERLSGMTRRRDRRASPRSMENYELRQVIATGGMGVVYEGFDKSLKRRVAVKKMRGEIRDDPKERDRFLKEARTVAGLRHPNIVQIHSIIEEGRNIYLVFEFIEGKTLKDYLAAKGKLPLKEALEIFAGVCAALDYAHSRGVIHRDLKPSNIMVDSELVARVMDFGVAKAAQDALVRAAVTNTVLGTPQYMAPEAEDGVVSKESDLYSLGVVLYELVTGKPPFEGGAGAMYVSKMRGNFDPPSRAASVPKAIDAVVARALAPEAEDRFPRARDIQAALEAIS